MTNRPHRIHPSAAVSDGDFVPSWQRPTKPESRWAAFGAVLVIIAAMLVARAVNIARG